MDEELWETVAIYKSDILQCAFHEQNGVIELEISLKSPVCDLYPSQHQDVNDNKIKINFYPELEEHIAHAVGCTFDFGEKRSKVSTVNTPLQISMKKVQNADLLKNVKYCIQNPTMPSPAQTSSQDSVTRRRKISVPSIPMAVPIISPAACMNHIDQQGTAYDSIPETQMEEPFIEKTVANPKLSSDVKNANQDNKTISEKSTKDFAVPKTPVKKTRSRVKVKTPVVSVTPPSRKTRKQSAQCSVAEGESVRSQTLPKENKQHEVVIPDLLPFNDNLCKSEKASMSKASISNEKSLDDSGIGIDESRSSIVCDALDISKNSQETNEVDASSSIFGEKIETRKNSKKVMSRKTAQNQQAEGKLKNVKDNRDKFTPLNEVTEEDTSVEGDKENVIESTTDGKDTNFGFHAVSINEPVVSIPDSLENSICSDKQSCTEEEMECKSKSNTSVNGKKRNKTKSKKGTNIVQIDHLGSVGKDDEKTGSGKKKGMTKKKSFTDIDESLKELHDLENNEDILKEEIQGDNERSKSKEVKEGDNDGDVYAFSDPDPYFHKKRTSDKQVLDKRYKTKSGEDNRKEANIKRKAVCKQEEPVISKHVENENNVTTGKQHDRPKQGGDNEKECYEIKSKDTDKFKAKDQCKQRKDEKCYDELKGEGKKYFNKNLDKDRQDKSELIEQRDLKRGRAKRTEKVQKADNDANENKSDNKKVGRSLRKRGNQSNKGLENRRPEEISSPSSSSESIGSQGKHKSQMTVPSTEKTQEKSMDRKTPENSPSKIAVNEQKIKSSLKKNKNSSEPEKDTNKRKSRVSFNLPNRQSQESDTQVDEQHNKPQNENLECEHKLSDVVEDNKFKTEHLNHPHELDDETAEIKENINSGASYSANSKKSSAKNKLIKGNNKSKKEVVEETMEIDDKYALSKLIPCVSSPMSYSDSSDSLYIESDDSYNARRYKMENGRWNTSKRKKRSSLKPRRNDTSEEAKTENHAFNAHSDVSRPVLKELGNICNKNTTKGREKSKKDGKKSNEQVKGFANTKKADKEPDEKSYSSKFDLENRNGKIDIETIDIKKGKVLMHNSCSKMLTDNENSLSEREHFREESEQFDKGLNMEIENVEEIHELQEAIVPYVKTKENATKVSKEGKNSEKKMKTNSTFSMEQSFEKVECDDSFAVSQQSIQTISNAKGKSLVFQMSYLKSKTNYWNRNNLNTEKPPTAPSYDPYDFEAHCENASMASEKVGRKDKLNSSKQKKPDKKKRPNSKEHKVKVEKIENSSLDSQESFSQEIDDRNVSKCEKNSSGRQKHQSHESSKKKKDSKTERLNMNKNSINHIPAYSSNLQDYSSQEMVVDLTHEKDQFQNDKHAETNLVQDKKTKKWYRTNKDNVEEYAENSRKENKRNKAIKERVTGEFPSVDSFNKGMMTSLPSEDEAMIIDSSMEQNISQFSKILKEITSRRQICDKDLNFSINADLDDDIADIKTPCIESISCTPKVWSGKRKQYNPLNVSVIKTPQSCKLTDTEDDEDSDVAKSKPIKRKSRKKKTVKYKEVSESESEDEKSECRSRMSTESVSLLDSSQNIYNRSEKSWILERKKTPKLKKSSKTYKASKKNKNRYYQDIDDSIASEDNSDDEQDGLMKEDGSLLEDKLHMMKEYLQQMGTPLTIPSLSLKTPILTPSMKSLKSLEDINDSIPTPSSPRKRNKKGNKYKDDIDVEQIQENCSISLNMSGPNSEEECDSSEDMESQAVVSLKSYEGLNHSDESADDEDRFKEKLLQQNMKLLAESGFTSGPSSEMRPTRSSLKRRFSDIEENRSLESSISSQVESEDEMEKSVFVPKKLFKFDPAVNTPQAPSLYSDGTEETEIDFGFQSGLSTVMAAFGTDIQHHLRDKKQKIERFTKETLKETQKHFHHTLVEQQQYLSNITDDFSAKMLLELTALENDIERLSDAEKKMEEYFKSQFDTLICNEESQIKRLNNMKKLHSCFLDKSKKVNKYNYNAHKNFQEQMKKDMAALQKKLVAETQRQQYMDVKMKLQQMF
ncbi:uncharacterized protein LOC132750058 [Ruditapes philippinarum]|uniref:uncharacterized protein LOC132750058 n=1 Tax=Ruditapes philippinarum TaxID=129788 RepID=UPI00295B858E|nr:uncharacterized protein LOC132750058 [Ruditapes philippinarum]